MTPIMAEQEVLQQIWCEYTPTFDAFMEDAIPKVEAARRGAPFPMSDDGEDFLCASCLPWLHFTAVSQAAYTFGQAIPVLAWGKLKNGCIPLSCKCSHAFLDGLHIGRFWENIERSFARPETLWNVASDIS